MKPFTTKHCTPINYGQPKTKSKKEKIGSTYTTTGPQDIKKGYYAEPIEGPKGLYTSDANKMMLKAVSKKLPKK